MFGVVVTIHILACALLILIVLIQQGKGGGLIDSLSSAESIFGTKTNTFLIKATSVLAVVFFLTCLGLAFLSIQQSKSIVETSYRPPPTAPTAAVGPPPVTSTSEQAKTPAAASTQAPATAKASETTQPAPAAASVTPSAPPAQAPTPAPAPAEQPDKSAPPPSA